MKDVPITGMLFSVWLTMSASGCRADLNCSSTRGPLPAKCQANMLSRGDWFSQRKYLLFVLWNSSEEEPNCMSRWLCCVSLLCLLASQQSRMFMLWWNGEKNVNDPFEAWTSSVSHSSLQAITEIESGFFRDRQLTELQRRPISVVEGIRNRHFGRKWGADPWNSIKDHFWRIGRLIIWYVECPPKFVSPRPSLLLLFRPIGTDCVDLVGRAGEEVLWLACNNDGFVIQNARGFPVQLNPNIPRTPLDERRANAISGQEFHGWNWPDWTLVIFSLCGGRIILFSRHSCEQTLQWIIIL